MIRKLALVLGLLIVGTYAQTTGDASSLNPPECGIRTYQVSSRSLTDKKIDYEEIVGGKVAEEGDWGWQASLLILGSHFCGGTLINSQWIMTAAHCLDAEPYISDWTIKLGYYKKNHHGVGSVIANVSKAIMHPNFDSKHVFNDIALIKLSAPVQYNHIIRPACVPTSKMLHSGKTSWATGWGITQTDSIILAENLMEVSIPVLPDSECEHKFGHIKIDLSTAFCAGKNGTGDTCQGDSGGPLVVQDTDEKWYAVGITSWGRYCAMGGVYTKTAAFYDWINSTINSN